jgi:uncharacterized membrane protein
VSDESQGPGWWLASDGKWYPPELAPGAQPAVSPSRGAAPTKVDVGAALTYAWQKFQQNAGPLLLITLIIVVAYVVGIILSYSVDNTFGYIVFQVLVFFAAQILTLGLYRAGLMVTAGERPEPGRVFATDRLGDFILASILYSLIVTVGLILCIIPGIAAAIALYFYGFYVLDRGLGPTDSLRASYELVRANVGTVVVLLLVAWLVYFVGILLCGIGVFVTAPVALIMVSYGYRILNNEPVAP